MRDFETLCEECHNTTTSIPKNGGTIEISEGNTDDVFKYAIKLLRKGRGRSDAHTRAYDKLYNSELAVEILIKIDVVRKKKEKNGG
ncbi:MAG TPA: hypothetical protein ENH82_06725 [bacterium]|nr:hypothetical protein [bacterium]